MLDNMLGGALAEVAGPLKDFSEKLGGPNGSMWLTAFKRFLRRENPWGVKTWPVWKTVKLGTGLKTADDFYTALKQGGYRISGWADSILGQPAFSASKTEMDMDLVNVSVAELGFKNGAAHSDIYNRAQELGLELCPAEVGPQLRLQYPDQPNGEWLIVAMEPITALVGNLGVFRVGYDNDVRWLDGDRGHPDSVWLGRHHFVFVHRK